jgi:hypothetical protein
MADEQDAGHGIDGEGTGSPDSASSPSSTEALLEHSAVLALGAGVSSQSVADFIQRLTQRSTDRILGIGQEQYESPEGQRFENYSLVEEYSELLDELADAISYVGFIAIKAGATVRALDVAGAAIEAAAELLSKEHTEVTDVEQ